jgi:hypothetical protein
MHDDETNRGLPPTVVQQPDPMLDEQQPGGFRIGLTLLGAAAIVVLVMYGLSQPAHEPQTASAPEAAQTNGHAAAPQAPPSTTGQGQADNQSPQGQGKSPRSDSATTGQASAPSDKAATDGAKKQP